jgi:hypothetical protein
MNLERAAAAASFINYTYYVIICFQLVSLIKNWLSKTLELYLLHTKATTSAQQKFITYHQVFYIFFRTKIISFSAAAAASSNIQYHKIINKITLFLSSYSLKNI